MKKKRKLTGPALMRANGNKLVSVWLDPAETLAVEKAARTRNMPVATFVRKAAFAIACGNHVVFGR